MKIFFVVYFIFIYTFIGLAQASSIGPMVRSKPPIDTNTFNTWPSLGDAGISNDGKYVFYKINYSCAPATLVIRSIDGSWRTTSTNPRIVQFTQDCRQVICLASGDSLAFYTLGTAEVRYVSHVTEFKLFSASGTEWLVYRLNSPDNELLFYNLTKGKVKSFRGINEYLVSHHGKFVIMNMVMGDGNAVLQELHWVNLSDESDKVIWKATEKDVKAGNLVLDDSDARLVFIVDNGKDKDFGKSLWYCHSEIDKSALIARKLSVLTFNSLMLHKISRFSLDGNRIFVFLTEKQMPNKIPGIAKVNVWSYMDTVIQSEQLKRSRSGEVKDYLAVIDLADGHILLLQQRIDNIIYYSGALCDDYVFMDDCQGNWEERSWSTGSQLSCYAISTSSGQRIPLNFSIISMSPDCKFFIGENRDHDIISYDMATGQTFNLTHSIPITRYKDESNLLLTKGIEFAAWVKGAHTLLLLYDRFDLWLIRLDGNKSVRNITHGYGRKSHIQLRLASQLDYDKCFIYESDRVLLRAFNLENKESGFYQFYLNNNRNPEPLTMGSYDYKPGYTPIIKARDSDVYLIKRASPTEFPNYMITRDFKTFHPVSEIYPEKDINWLTAKLVSFQTIDGSINQGILYKPENFDPSQRYPVIITYYEQKSDALFKYPELEDNDGSFWLPWFVSHGYIVFVPDIHYSVGKNGQDALHAVLGAAVYLSILPWIDAKHIGIQGHSFGGYETNYIITHTNRFAAAMSSCGVSDYISDYGDLWFNTYSKQNYVEFRQGRIHATLWQRPDLYIENSPIFLLNRISTPLLMVANMEDGNVSFAQGLALFLGLRRLGKKGWMLQYDGEGHGVGGKALVDLTIRSQQFYDYYLKGAEAPKWMVEGIPADHKGIDNGMELEPQGIKPGPGLLLKAVDK